jgi:hypothetical protein
MQISIEAPDCFRRCYTEDIQISFSARYCGTGRGVGPDSVPHIPLHDSSISGCEHPRTINGARLRQLTCEHFRKRGCGPRTECRAKKLTLVGPTLSQSLYMLTPALEALRQTTSRIDRMATTNGKARKNGPSPSVLPIVVAGGGCVGLFLALLLTQSSIPNRIIVSTSPYNPGGLADHIILLGRRARTP